MTTDSSTKDPDDAVGRAFKDDPPDEIAGGLINYLQYSAEHLGGPKAPEFMTPADKERLMRAGEVLQPAFTRLEKLLPRMGSESQAFSRRVYRLVHDLMLAAFVIGAEGVIPESANSFFESKARSKLGSLAGKVSWDLRKEDYVTMQDYGLGLAKAIRREKPGLSQTKLADEMQKQYKRKPKPVHETLVGHIRAWEKAGLLPKRVSKPKEPTGSHKRLSRSAG
jgi:hypothetical protein